MPCSVGGVSLPETLTATAFLSIREIKEQWLELLAQCPANTLFLTPQWQETWWESFGERRELAGFYLQESGSFTAIASLSRQGPALSFLGSPETFDYNDFLIRPGGEAAFFDALLNWLAGECWASLELPSLLETSPTLAALPGLARERGYSVEVAPEDVTPGLCLPDTWEQYLAGLSKKNRHELRRKLRRLDGAAGWRWYCVQEPSEVAGRLDDFLALMRRSDPEKAAYMTGEREGFFRRAAQRTAQLGWLRLFFLQMEGQDVAASLCFDYDNVRLLYNSGYNPDYGYYSVGLLLNALCLRESIELGHGYFDFLRGSEAYKYHLGGLNRRLYRMVIAQPSGDGGRS